MGKVTEAIRVRDRPEITEVTFGRVFNLGNFETFRVELKATVGPSQTAEEIVSSLDDMTVKMRNNHKKGEVYG
jgi:proteasome assembly chaperone (PAC2) family protein